MRETPGNKIISALEAAESIKARAMRINRLNAEIAEHFKGFARLQRSEPDPSASDADWEAYFALFDALETLVIDKFMAVRIERRAIVRDALPHMERDLTSTLDGASMAGSRFQKVADAFDVGISNLAIIGFTWASLRTSSADDGDDQEMESEA